MAGNGLPVRVLMASGRRSEGIAAAREISRMVGGIDMLDAGERARSGEEPIRSFSDIAGAVPGPTARWRKWRSF